MRFHALTLCLVALGSIAVGQETSPSKQPVDLLAKEEFLRPPKAIADLVLAPRHLNVTLSNLSPNGSTYLIAQSAGTTAMSQLSRPYLNLGGEMVDPVAYRDRSLNLRGSVKLDLYDWRTGKRVTLETPKDTLMGGFEWSPDGSQLAYWAHANDASRLYVADISSGKSKLVTNAKGLTTFTAKLQWVDSGRAIMFVAVPAGAKVPSIPSVPDQPIVRVSDPRKNSLRTYASLLQNRHEAALLEHFATGQLTRVELSSGRLHHFGAPTMIRNFDAAPNGKYARVTSMLKPFSYITPVSSFGQKEEVWDESGKVLAELSKRELGAEPPVGPTGPPGAGGRGGGQGGGRPDEKRSLAWRPDGQGLGYLQLEQIPRREGAEEGQRQPKDRVMQWMPPFGDKDAKVVYESADRITSIRYSADCKVLFLGESKSGNSNVVAVRLNDPSKRLPISTMKPDDFYGNPGTLMSAPGPLGIDGVRITPNGSVLLTGTEVSKTPLEQAPRPFLDAVDIDTGKKTRVWQGAADKFETLSTILAPDLSEIMISRQSPTEVPASYIVSTASKESKATIPNTDYSPEITKAPKARVQITRADGIKFWCQVTMPTWWVKGARMPAFFWFYPNEYRDQKGYDESQRSFNKNLYPSTSMSSKDFLITQGYAVIEPDCPIIGSATAINDNYVSDLRMNLSATIDTLEAQGYIDRTRLGIGGHSYGAFSTVNAMVHTPFFKAGIAGDGNYNRMLTPFAFQSEQRKLWEAKWTYLEMSPVLYAERLTGALLLYHGLDDQNVGTDPINSPRLFAMLEALGKPASMYLYPYEDHGPAAIETHLDLWARWVLWLDKYVKN